MGSLADHHDMAEALVITGHLDGYAVRDQSGRVVGVFRSLQAAGDYIKGADEHAALRDALANLDRVASFYRAACERLHAEAKAAGWSPYCGEPSVQFARRVTGAGS